MLYYTFRYHNATASILHNDIASVTGAAYRAAILHVMGATCYIRIAAHDSQAMQRAGQLYTSVAAPASVRRTHQDSSIEEDIAKTLPTSVSVDYSDASAPRKPVLERLSNAFGSSATIPLLAKSAPQHGGCHVYLDYTVGCAPLRNEAACRAWGLCHHESGLHAANLGGRLHAKSLALNCPEFISHTSLAYEQKAQGIYIGMSWYELFVCCYCHPAGMHHVSIAAIHDPSLDVSLRSHVKISVSHAG